MGDVPVHIKGFLSRFVVALGLLIGLFALARFGMGWPPLGDIDTDRWIAYPGAAFLGCVFIYASIIALRNPKRAGLIFILAMPVVVFCLAYPATGYLVWYSDGGAFQLPEFPTAIGLSIVFFLPIFAGLALLCRRKRAVHLLVFAVLLAGLVFGLSHWTKAFFPPFAGWSALFLVFGIFWYTTSRRGWSAVLKPRSGSWRQRAIIFSLTCIVILCLDVGMTFGLSAIDSSLFQPDCASRPVFVHPESPYHAVFTVRVIFVGRSVTALTEGKDIFPVAERRDSRVGDWGVGVIQQRFWGLPTWSRLVLLTDFVYRKNETYFIDGTRSQGLLTGMLPIVKGGMHCSRTKLARRAAVELHALQEASGPAAKITSK